MESIWYQMLVRCVFIDLGSYEGTLACVTEERVVAIQSVDGRLRDHELLALFQELLQEAGWDVSDLTHLACVTGPGGFMSLRVAVSFANALSHTQGIPVVGVHLSDLYAVRALSPGEREMGEDCVWLHSTKRHQLFVRGFGALALRWPKPLCMEFTTLLQELPKRVSYIGEVLPEHQELLGQEKIVTQRILTPLHTVLPRFLLSFPMERRLLIPWYGRDH